MKSRTLLLALAALLALGCGGRTYLLRHDLPAAELGALVDSDPARDLLADLLARRSSDPRLTALASRPDVVQEIGTGIETDVSVVRDQARLRELAQDVSLDFAALSFARAVSADGPSRAAQASFHRFLADSVVEAEQSLRRPGAFPYTVLFAPSWMYRSHPETGADFAHQRRILDRLGVENRLIPSRQDASVEDNAVAIAAAIRAHARDGNGLIVVSASKSGAEAALALSRVLAPEEAAPVVAWINIVGALGGSPLADTALRPPTSWVARGVFWLRGWNWAGMVSMATDASRERLRGARIPESIAVVNVVAVPLSRTVGPAVWFGYSVLRRHGPNDGAVLLTDTVWPGGINLVAIGPDHLFAPREDDAHTLAMLRAVAEAIRP
ncbi:MAG TPA: hypothetical protein VGT02_10540 [Methylomirabilota bacterium]|nr:hypothetical protein [Methylomirabilota bacterium]